MNKTALEPLRPPKVMTKIIQKSSKTRRNLTRVCGVTLTAQKRKKRKNHRQKSPETNKGHDLTWSESSAALTSCPRCFSKKKKGFRNKGGGLTWFRVWGLGFKV